MNFDISPVFISVKTSITATVITFFIGIFAARFMSNYKGKLKNILDTVFTLPLVLPPTVVGYLLLLLFGKNGPLGQFLIKFEYTIIFSWPATVIAATVVAFPLMYRTSRGAFEQIETNVVNAARTLGASEWKIFYKVILPLALPGVASGTLLSFARALGEFGATLMIAGDIPNRTQTIPVAIYFAAEDGNMNEALIWVIIIVIISMIVIFSMNIWFQKGTKKVRKKYSY
jgi:molybdate transport system permease protein